MGLFTLILFAVCFGFWYAKHDYQEIVTGYIINHSRGLRIRISVLLATSLLASFWSYGIADWVLSVLSLVLFLVLSGAIFWVVFELRFNHYFINSNPFYVGNTSDQDKFLRKYKITGEMLFLFKIFVIVISFSAILAIKFITSHLEYFIHQVIFYFQAIK